MVEENALGVSGYLNRGRGGIGGGRGRGEKYKVELAALEEQRRVDELMAAVCDDKFFSSLSCCRTLFGF